MTKGLDLSAAFGEEAQFVDDGSRANASVRCAVLHADISQVRSKTVTGLGAGASEDRSAAQRRRSAQAELEEIKSLTAALGLEIVHDAVANLREIKPGTFLSAGVIDDLSAWVKAYDLVVVVINAGLSPIQHRNLEREIGCKVLDRTALILEIFGARARTREGRLQVELASLTFQRSRLVRSWTHLERQRGGAGFMGGPGESQIEIDRRLIDERIVRLKKDLEQVQRTRSLHRSARDKVPYPVVALVGYTNAGKSTLFNRLTNADVLAKDMLFATLDPTLRELPLPGGDKVLLADTVGFVSNLPHELVAAFRATLEEVRAARLILHVIDLSNPDFVQQIADVDHVLTTLDVPQELLEEIVFIGNKIDLAPPEAIEVFEQRYPADRRLCLSALSDKTDDELFSLLDRRLFSDHLVREIELNYADQSRELAWLYDNGKVLERQDKEESCRVTVRLSPLSSAQYDHHFNG